MRVTPWKGSFKAIVVLFKESLSKIYKIYLEEEPASIPKNLSIFLKSRNML